MRKLQVGPSPWQVQVIRTPSKSKYAPSQGIRYNDLHEVKAEEVLNKEKAMHSGSREVKVRSVFW